MRLFSLKRLSPCCHERVAHDRPISSKKWDRIVCVGCREPVEEFLLENAFGEIVWPPDPKVVEAVRPWKRAKKSRRKPTEAEPEPYRLVLPGSRG